MMKKVLALLLSLCMLAALAGCGKKEEGISHADYEKAALDTEVTVTTYVQAHQSWWDNKVTAYCQSKDGAYYLYDMACSEEDAAKLVPGTKIVVTGYKSEWSGEVEITDATFKFADGNDKYVASATDVTKTVGTDDLAKHMNEFVSFKGMTIEDYDGTGAAFAYKNAEEKTDDLYFKASVNGTSIDFCVEYYLTNEETDVYKAVEGLKVGDTVDIEGFLYYYNDANPHVTGIIVK